MRYESCYPRGVAFLFNDIYSQVQGFGKGQWFGIVDAGSVGAREASIGERFFLGRTHGTIPAPSSHYGLPAARRVYPFVRWNS
jgi:hypothetical protein